MEDDAKLSLPGCVDGNLMSKEAGYATYSIELWSRFRSKVDDGSIKGLLASSDGRKRAWGSFIGLKKIEECRVRLSAKEATGAVSGGRTACRHLGRKIGDANLPDARRWATPLAHWW